jgi:hypothetical protein
VAPGFSLFLLFRSPTVIEVSPLRGSGFIVVFVFQWISLRFLSFGNFLLDYEMFGLDAESSFRA